MGEVDFHVSHERPSSGMCLATRWKNGQLRLVMVSALSSFVIISICLLLLHSLSKKSITLVLNGVEQTVVTTKWDVQDLLKQQDISLAAHDRINVPLDDRLKPGERIVIDQAIPVQVLADGEISPAYTTGRTVAAALADLGVRLGPDDKVYPAPGEKLAEDDTIRVVRVEKVIENEEQEVPFQVVRRDDPQLLKGKQQVVQQGANGLKLEKVLKIYEDGVLTSVRVLDSTETESVDKIVALGTKKPVTVLSASSPAVEKVSKQGVTFEVKQILTNVILSAYDAGPGSTGKTEGDPQYGMTYTGTEVMEGRTIAVDPRVIPLGWWVYIEGYGFRRAEDIGSGVKGKWVDLYVQDPNVATRFGLKRGVTVYIIGPTRPQAG